MLTYFVSSNNCMFQFSIDVLLANLQINRTCISSFSIACLFYFSLTLFFFLLSSWKIPRESHALSISHSTAIFSNSYSSQILLLLHILHLASSAVKKLHLSLAGPWLITTFHVTSVFGSLIFVLH